MSQQKTSSICFIDSVLKQVLTSMLFVKQSLSSHLMFQDRLKRECIDYLLHRIRRHSVEKTHSLYCRNYHKCNRCVLDLFRRLRNKPINVYEIKRRRFYFKARNISETI